MGTSINQNRDILLSLMEPAKLISLWFREKAIQQLLMSNNAVPNQDMLNYDPGEVLTALLDDIFIGEYDCLVENASCSYGVSVLIKDGLDRRDAFILADQALRSIISIILTFIPNAKLMSSEEYRYSIVDDYDLYIARQYKG